MKILIFLGIPLLLWAILMLLSLPQVLETEEDWQKLQELEAEEPPHFARDYSGRLWVEKRRKSFFRPIHRRARPPGGVPDDSTE